MIRPLQKKLNQPSRAGESHCLYWGKFRTAPKTKTFDILSYQVHEVIKDLSELSSQIIIAYEPVWAIGTGLTATEAQAEEVHAFLRELLARKFGPESAQNCPIIYGGSVKAENVASLLKQPNIDGALVGGASVDPKGFRHLVDCALR